MAETKADYSYEEVGPIVVKIAEKIKQNVEILAELDGLSGDGDLGETMEKSANAMIQTAGMNQGSTDIGAFLMKTAASMNQAAPSTLGTLLSCAVMACAKEFKGQQRISAIQVSQIPAMMAASIGERGKAKLGDKTILDALIPMSEAILETFGNGMADVHGNETQRLKIAFHEGAMAARAGAQHTSTMVPKAGRAQWIGERVSMNLDAGAVLCAIVGELFLLEDELDEV